MKNLKTIKSLFFGKAEYYLGDAGGNSLLLKVDYQNNDYSLVIMKKRSPDIKFLKNEADEIATDLLRRKSKVNFAAKNC